jgi:hypothetical protein
MNYSTFFQDAREGTLPNFAMINPNGSRCDHPCADIAHGERLDKDIYEALRAGPAWNKTLFLIVWDDVRDSHTFTPIRRAWLAGWLGWLAWLACLLSACLPSCCLA